MEIWICMRSFFHFIAKGSHRSRMSGINHPNDQDVVWKNIILIIFHLETKWYLLGRNNIFTRPLLPEGSSLQVEILFVCLSVRHHFNISVLWPSNHPRIMSDPTYYIPSDLAHVWWCQEHVWWCLVVSDACLVVSGGVNVYWQIWPHMCYIFENMGLLSILNLSLSLSLSSVMSSFFQWYVICGAWHDSGMIWRP